MSGRELNEAEKDALKRVKAAGQALMHVIQTFVPESRESLLAKMKVDEAVMWAVKGLAG